MSLLTIEIIDDKALKLIKDLEDLNIIKIVESNGKLDKAGIAARLWASISREESDEMHKELQNMRDEWERPTY